MAPLVVMSGLAAIVAAGDRIRIEHQYLIGYAWLALIVLPPLLVALAIMIQPWIVAADLSVGRPAAEMGQFFGDSFARRTGRPLTVVGGRPDAGDRWSRSARRAVPACTWNPRPTDRSHVTRQDIAEKGAVILWPATDSAGRPPPEILRQFPDLRSRCRAFVRNRQFQVPHAARCASAGA